MVPGRVPTVAEEPGGLLYVPELVTEVEEADLVAAFEAGPFEEVRMHGQTALRTVRHFGYRYDYEGLRLVSADPLPASIAWLRDGAAALAEVDPADFTETLVSRYPPGAGIGWHRDAPLSGRRWSESPSSPPAGCGSSDAPPRSGGSTSWRSPPVRLTCSAARPAGRGSTRSPR